MPWTNVFYLNLTDDGTQTSADLKTVIDALMTSYNTNIVPRHCTTISVTDVKATWITGTSTALEYENSVNYTGALTTDVNDASACIVVNWAINQYYRGGHPRTYHASIQTAQITNGSQVSSGVQTSTASAYNAWLTAVNALTATHISAVALGTVSFARGGNWRSPPVFYGYKGVSVRNFLGTQRRRIGGR